MSWWALILIAIAVVDLLLILFIVGDEARRTLRRLIMERCARKADSRWAKSHGIKLGHTARAGFLGERSR